MSEEIKLQGKIYTIRQISLSGFFLGFFNGIFFLYQNFESFGEHKKAKKTLIIGIIGIIIQRVLLYFISKDSGLGIRLFLGWGVQILYQIIVILSVYHFQKGNITKHLNQGGEKNGRLKVIGVAFILIILYIIGGEIFNTILKILTPRLFYS